MISRIYSRDKNVLAILSVNSSHGGVNCKNKNSQMDFDIQNSNFEVLT